MIRRPSASAVVWVLASCVGVFSRPAIAQDALGRAKELYLSAAYDDALSVLSAYHPAPGETSEVAEYRAFCYLALGKVDDATKAIEEIVEANPLFQPPEGLVSPRVQEAFHSVRRRVLPSIVRQTYVDAKAAFDRSDVDAAAKGFERVATLLADGDIGTAGDLSDLRLLSKGFAELIQRRQADAVRPAPAEVQPAATQPPSDVDRIYGPEDRDVTPPVAISQPVPPWRPTGAAATARDVVLMIVVDESGTVASVRLAGAVTPSYDASLRQAVSHWKYRPAMRNGQAVKYLKAVGIRLQPAGARQ